MPARWSRLLAATVCFIAGLASAESLVDDADLPFFQEPVVGAYRALAQAWSALNDPNEPLARALLPFVDRGSRDAGEAERALLAAERAELLLQLERDPKARLELADVLREDARTRASAHTVRVLALRALGRGDDADREERAHPEWAATTTGFGPREWTTRLDARVASGLLRTAAREAAALSLATRTHDAVILAAAVRAHVRGQDTDRALALLEYASTDAGARARILSSSSGQDVVHDLLAWTLGKALRVDDAVARYDLLATTTKDAARSADACFLAGFLRYESDALDDARARFRRCLDEGKTGAREVALHWYLALSSWHGGAHADALAELATLVERFPRDREARKHRFFHARFTRSSEARALVDDAARARAERALRALDDENPIDWYGMLARRELGLAPRGGAKVPHDALARRAPTDKSASRAIAIAEHGFTRYAARAVVDRGTKDAASIALAAKVGAHHLAWRRASTVMPRALTTKGGALANDAGWRASYATPHRALVDEHAKKADVPMSFVYAIMRTESGFDERALSVAGARGLLQLMPHTAIGIAEHIRFDAYHQDRGSDDVLYEPSAIIPLGAATLGLWKAETGNLLLTAAAYNGAPENVVRWVERTYALDVVEFVERIPFKETRDYVKSVLAAEAVYRALEGEPLSLALPERIEPFEKQPTVFVPADR